MKGQRINGLRRNLSLTATGLMLGGCAMPASSPPAATGSVETGRVETVQPSRQNAAESKAALPRRDDSPTASGETALRVVRASDGDAPKDPQPALDIAFKVEVYQLTLPRGAVSQNAEFWNRLNEQVIDPASYDVLQRNGVRVGEAAFSDWSYFRALIDQHPGKAAQAVSVAREQKNLQLEMKTGIPLQDIFHFSSSNALTGRTYERCTNLFSIGFEPTPRKPGSMRLTLAPVVRSERRRLEFSVLNDERGEVQYVQPEMIYDCNLRLDVPMDSFIVVAPSPEARWPVSVGNAFLLTEGKSELLEQVLIIVPRPFQTGEGK
ncbi:MAG TPA: hypothetical protein PLD59_13040 [Tepidisphaeraceae bacterium]|nr:hypothetical protein [Tepidisphaeraceae bacterium]